ncbi:MAG: L-aspartate oxidase [Deltaproteobacteria bacterium]|nr:L-aspartate oxidase [Deltaproteobacteria bacterium]
MEDMSKILQFDFIVIGSGIAGITYALKVAQAGKVALLTKKNRSDSNTNYAQGGIATVFNSDDSPQSHIQDTLEAGAGLCHRDVVEKVIAESQAAIEELIQIGVEFSKNATGHFDLGREGGHSRRRVLHAKDITGQEIERALLNAVQRTPNITLFEHQMVVDFIMEPSHRILGLYAQDSASGKIVTFAAPIIMLATGGAGKVYKFTSNPDIATGDGIALAWRAGAKVGNLEFVQFHPTSLYHPTAKNFLLSEALRGEGGKLQLTSGEEFMQHYHPLGALAPRDIVARAIDAEMKKAGTTHVLLDMTHLDSQFLKSRFPQIHEKLISFGLDMTQEPLPVVPAAHYMCGGVCTDLHGETTIQNLFAAGEVACTGFHGANRLASNSLLEAVVFSKNAASRSLERFKTLSPQNIRLPEWKEGGAVESKEKIIITQNWTEIRKLMWNYVGIVRSQNRLLLAKQRLQALRHEIEEYYWKYKITPDFLELRNLSLVVQLIVECALRRKESRGLHYITDYPNQIEPKDTILDPAIDKIAQIAKD